MKQVFCTWCAIIALLLVGGLSYKVSAQVSSATPDPFAVQLTSSPTTGFFSFVADVSADGRFVVVVSNGDIATEKIPTRKPDGTPNVNPRNNEDGNYEIFLIDYAQRRIFQITNTKSVPNPAASPTPTPSPSPSPSASPTPSPSAIFVPEDAHAVKVQMINGANGHLAQISLQPKLDSSGKRTYVIVFSSTAPSPGNFDGTALDSAGVTALANDANTEVWIYEVPAVADVDLTSGADIPFIDLAKGTFTPITINTAASTTPATRPGTAASPAFFADDNREATISDDGNRIAFVSTRNLVANGNADANPEIFLFNRVSGLYAQLTNTKDLSFPNTIWPIFNSNPNLSSDGSVVAFLSNANLAGANADNANGTGNAEIYVANYDGTSFSGVRQVTKTKEGPTFASVNFLQPGRRLSRDGSMLAFDSLADDPKANGTNQAFSGIFVCALSAAGDTFTLVGTRSTVSPGDIFHFPTFTDYNGALKPSTLVFASALNFKTDGTFPTTATDGLNPSNVAQIFTYPLPINSANTFARLTNNPSGGSFGGLRPITSASRKRLAVSVGGVELGGGNADQSTEVFYLLTPTVLTESSAALSFFAGATAFGPVPAPSPSASPTPTPSPSPSPGTALGLSAGELSLIRSTADIAPATTGTSAGSETRRSPALPVELNGVSVSVNGGAAGLYALTKTPQQINVVMPIGLATTGAGNVVVNNNGTVTRGQFQIVAAQPDIFSTTMDAGGNAFVADVTNPNNRIDKTGQPISVTSKDKDGLDAPTVLEIDLTGVRLATLSSIKVTIGTTDITTIAFIGPNPEMPGWDVITVTLPDTLKGAGVVPIIVTSSTSGATSRPADTAPTVNIGP